jgi:hypothetical protein
MAAPAAKSDGEGRKRASQDSMTELSSIISCVKFCKHALNERF